MRKQIKTCETKLALFRLSVDKKILKTIFYGFIFNVSDIFYVFFLVVGTCFFFM